MTCIKKNNRYVRNCKPKNTIHFRKNPAAKKFEDDWEIPIISEETLDKLTTMFTIYPE